MVCPLYMGMVKRPLRGNFIIYTGMIYGTDLKPSEEAMDILCF
jgi:hypothetical protein